MLKSFARMRDVAYAWSIKLSVLSAGAVALVLCCSPSVEAVVVTDDFSDGTDTGSDPLTNPTWTHLDGYLGSTGQTWDASSGAYRLTAPSNGFNNVGVVASHVGPSFTDVRVTMDLVDFHTVYDPEVGPPGPSFPHIMARSNGDNDFAELTGYAYGYDFVAAGGAGEVVLYRIEGGGISDIGSQRVHLDETKDYRFVLEVIGEMIHGRVFNLTDGGAMIAESFAKITGQSSFFASGTSGTFGYTQAPFSTDFTIDNFRTETAVAGDYNRDGVNDAADYILWRKTVGQQSPQLAPGTFTVTGFGNMQANGAVSGACGWDQPNCEVINAADYTVWYTNFGKSVPASPGAGGGGVVPEPAIAALVLVGVTAMSLRRRRAAS
jgi:hypothetical protein